MMLQFLHKKGLGWANIYGFKQWFKFTRNRLDLEGYMAGWQGFSLDLSGFGFI